MKYLAVLGRQPEISLSELEALFSNVQKISQNLASFNINTKNTSIKRHKGKISDSTAEGAQQCDKISNLSHCEAPEMRNFCVEPNINRLGGTLKLAIKLDYKPLEFLQNLPAGKITFGISDYSNKATNKSARLEALKLKKILIRHGRSVRVVENRQAVLSTATSLHNGLSSQNERKVEFIKLNQEWYKVIGVQNINAYARRDQARPARDAKVGMLPPKLAQILINLCGPLPQGSHILDPFCGTGVLLQEALLMGYQAYGTDIDKRMVEYSNRNIKWISKNTLEGTLAGCCRECRTPSPVKTGARTSGPEKVFFEIQQGDATDFQWSQPIDAVACESYLGQPMSQIPTDIKLKQQEQECSTIILGFLKNLSNQIKPNTPIILAAPAWLRADGTYKRLEILAFLDKLGYNVNNKTREGLLYYRNGQIVARDILILRKK
ncbi:hypothetical protein IKG05_00505 [Candidatus Saccharibacteria bacterium]|nr:hypothetical protein [Candidatus Saccharibacteria bacterium]